VIGVGLEAVRLANMLINKDGGTRIQKRSKLGGHALSRLGELSILNCRHANLSILLRDACAAPVGSEKSQKNFDQTKEIKTDLPGIAVIVHMPESAYGERIILSVTKIMRGATNAIAIALGLNATVKLCGDRASAPNMVSKWRMWSECSKHNNGSVLFVKKRSRDVVLIDGWGMLLALTIITKLRKYAGVCVAIVIGLWDFSEIVRTDWMRRQTTYGEI
jgi:hypothetical protein